MADLKIFAEQSDEGTPYWFLGGLSIVKISSEQSGGALSVVEDRRPAGRRRFTSIATTTKRFTCSKARPRSSAVRARFRRAPAQPCFCLAKSRTASGPTRPRGF